MRSKRAASGEKSTVSASSVKLPPQDLPWLARPGGQLREQISALPGDPMQALLDQWNETRNWGADRQNIRNSGLPLLQNFEQTGQTQNTRQNPGLFGAGIYIPALYVPLLLVSHVLVFMLLLRPGSEEQAS